MNILFKIPKYQLYLLQLENYELKRYLKLVLKKGLLPPKMGLRKSLIWTNKAILIFAVTEGLIFGLAGLFAWFLHGSVLENWVAAAIAFIGTITILKFFSFGFFCLAAILIWPVDFFFKFWIVARAKSRVKSLPQVKIIGIAGSYGKTTMKEILLEVLGVKLNVAATPESVNTPVGIARWIMRKFDPSLEVAIVEMGEHYQGDIKEICKIAKPEIAVITGINEAHLERMKNPHNVVSAIFEAVEDLKPAGMVVLNWDDANVAKNYQKYIQPSRHTEKYQAANIQHEAFDTQKLCWKLQMGDLGESRLYLLGEYALGQIEAAIKIAKKFGVPNEEIKKGIEKIRPVEHRLEPKFAPGDILVIDDAYNGNSDGAREAIKVLKRFKDKRKIYITPGLVETGQAALKVHYKIGQELASAADVVILIKNSVTGWIEEGIKQQVSSSKLKKPEIIWFETAQEAHSSLSKILRPNDVILFQNDWGDQYF